MSKAVLPRTPASLRAEEHIFVGSSKICSFIFENPLAGRRCNVNVCRKNH
ncbi:Hypothetical protein FKW44_011079 [Caligus rogercresseyi]|uniref:Uncharacterized protein n=1 Tax=Caligus rogercresseyi TaxID=217165 RepID=A0A7T8HHT5_CALRO|nr:Hypothetical protein FKW44_011079 [Caligus rogercresseyi]